jgi:hypothetical protein
VVVGIASEHEMSLHEEFHRDDHPKGSSDRSFGLVFAAFCAIMAARDAWLSSKFFLPWLGATLVFLGCAFVYPRVLAPLNWAWTRLGLLLFKIVSPIVLGLLYALCFVPIGLIAKATGKDFLRLKRPAHVETYWVRRIPPGPTPASMRKQF